MHLGDAIAIGPFPAECLDTLLNVRATRFIIGNHDEYFAYGLPEPRPSWMSAGEVEHQQWTHSQLDPALRAIVAGWPYRVHEDFDGSPTSFVRYPLDCAGRKFLSIIKQLTAAVLDQAFAVFAPERATLHFYDHQHRPSDLAGQTRYVNPGSLGCASEPIARYALVEYEHGGYRVEHPPLRMATASCWRPSRRGACRSGISSIAVFRRAFPGRLTPRSQAAARSQERRAAREDSPSIVKPRSGAGALLAPAA